MKEIKTRGGYIIAQDEETCVVYGMPKAVVNARLADAVLPADRIPDEILRIL
jgi:two-component system chemotaxis response regulator CheB